MNKEDLYPLIGKYLNGYKIIKIEEYPFVKGQINLWTDEWITEYFGDKSMVKFFVRPKSNSSKIYKELIDKEIYQLKDNWNKLKEYIGIKLYNVEYLQKLCGCRIDDEIHIILDIIKKEIQELERGNKFEK